VNVEEKTPNRRAGDKNMKLMLHTPDGQTDLSVYYQHAFDRAVEIYIVTAFLTDWDTKLKLNKNCGAFRLIIGKDFGITRKAACQQVMRWLPAQRKDEFLVADRMDGVFHPKAIFWREPSGKSFAVIGSSNLTRAAFDSNYEVNTYSPLSTTDYAKARKWINRIEANCRVVNADWLRKYKERKPIGGGGHGRRRNLVLTPPVVSVSLPEPDDLAARLIGRRKQLAIYRRHRAGLMSLFRRCAAGQITSGEFYDQLGKHWSWSLGDQLQSNVWKLTGRSANFQIASQSFLKILDAKPVDRDYVVGQEIDRLVEQGVPVWRAFFTEMLCLRFPQNYPIWNEPTDQFFRLIKLRPPRGASKGARYRYLAKTLRDALHQHPDHLAQNLAELDLALFIDHAKRHGKPY
jgi:HKD family nuclease